MFSSSLASRDFSKSTIRSLARAGVSLVSPQLVPGRDGSWAAAERAYLVNDNGTARVWSFIQVLEAAK